MMKQEGGKHNVWQRFVNIRQRILVSLRCKEPISFSVFPM